MDALPDINLAPEKNAWKTIVSFWGKRPIFLGGVCCQFQGGYFFFNSESSEIMEKHLNNAEFQARVFWPRMNRGGTGSWGKDHHFHVNLP